MFNWSLTSPRLKRLAVAIGHGPLDRKRQDDKDYRGGSGKRRAYARSEKTPACRKKQPIVA